MSETLLSIYTMQNHFPNKTIHGKVYNKKILNINFDLKKDLRWSAKAVNSTGIEEKNRPL